MNPSSDDGEKVHIDVDADEGTLSRTPKLPSIPQIEVMTQSVTALDSSHDISSSAIASAAVRKCRPTGVKEVKDERAADMKQNRKECESSAAFTVFGSRFGAMGDMMVRCAQEHAFQEKKRADRELSFKEKEKRLRRNAEDLKSVQVLFNNKSRKSCQFRDALHR